MTEQWTSNPRFSTCDHGVYGMHPDACGICLAAERDQLRAALVNLLSWLPPVDMDKNYRNDGRNDAIQHARKALAGGADETNAAPPTWEQEPYDTGTIAGMRRYIFEQLGFLTDDDNRPVEAILRKARQKLLERAPTCICGGIPKGYKWNPLCEVHGNRAAVNGSEQLK